MPPSPISIGRGLAYAFLIATKIKSPGDPAAHPQTIPAIWQALWAHWMLVMLSGVVARFLDSISEFVMFAILAVIVTFLYPVVSYSIITILRAKANYPAFIIAMVWINNLRQLLVVGLVFLPILPIAVENIQWALVPIAIWMLWALWYAATVTLQRGGLIGLAMLILLLAVEMGFTYVLLEVVIIGLA